jgi:hypothetical protein
MAEEKDGEGDIHDYIKSRFTEAGLNPDTEPSASHNLIVEACSDYLIMANHNTVEDYEYHYITIVRISDQIYASHRRYQRQTRDILSSTEEIPVSDDIVSEYADQSGRYVIGNTITLVYSMAYEFVNDMLGELITDLLRDEVPKSGKNAIKSQISSYAGRADTLVASDVISSDQREVIRHISDIRRDLVHDVEERYTLSVLDDLNQINRVPHILNELYEMVYDEPALYYYDDLEPEDLISSE